MLRSIQFLESFSGFFHHRLKLRNNHYRFSLISLSAKSSSRTPSITILNTPHCSRQFRASSILSKSKPDVALSSSSSSDAFRSTICGGPTKYVKPDGDEKERALCTSCGKITYENPTMVVGCLIEHDNKILLCKRKIQPSYGLWTLPAGYMETGESASEGAVRETWEEAGAKVKITSPFAQLDIPLIGQCYLIFLAKMTTPHFSPGPESSDCQFFALDDIPYESLSFSSMLITLKLYIEDIKVGRPKFHYGLIEKRPGSGPSEIHAHSFDYHLRT